MLYCIFYIFDDDDYVNEFEKLLIDYYKEIENSSSNDKFFVIIKILDEDNKPVIMITMN